MIFGDLTKSIFMLTEVDFGLSVKSHGWFFLSSSTIKTIFLMEIYLLDNNFFVYEKCLKALFKRVTFLVFTFMSKKVKLQKGGWDI